MNASVLRFYMPESRRLRGALLQQQQVELLYARWPAEFDTPTRGQTPEPPSI